MQKLKGIGLAATLLSGVGIGYLFRGATAPLGTAEEHRHEEPAAIEAWTCSMHPQIQLTGPGSCPICGMDLVPVRASRTGSGGPRQLVVSAAERELMRVETAPVERRFVEAEIRLVGKIAYDETRLAYITAWVPGRIERLFVDYTGVSVQAGDHMVDLYSPLLYSAQEELLAAKRATQELSRSGVDVLRDTARATVESAREKLRLSGLTEAQIAEIEERGEAVEQTTIYAPVGGLVIDKNALEGMHVETGTRIFTIADLGTVWIKLDAYESDLTWLRFGQEVSFETEAYPGEPFTGTVSFIDPVLDPRTRTVKVRVIAENADARLKPEMFVRATIRARVAEAGKVMDPTLAGKWVSPMHPEIVKDGPGECDVCGMDLVPAESLGYVVEEAAKPLVIPASAALLTGKRAVVYVQLEGAEEPTYEGREVVLGPRAGDWYVVRHGLEEGELVVVEGNFKIDSALQIQARPSMMNPDGGGSGGAHAHDHRAPPVQRLETPAAFREGLGELWAAYGKLHASLGRDDAPGALAAGAELARAASATDTRLLSESTRPTWTPMRAQLVEAIGAFRAETELAALRARFEGLSAAIEPIVRTFGLDRVEAIHVVRCPMAFEDRGAVWLQEGEAVLNPYLGNQMPSCGAVLETIPTTGKANRGH